MYGTVMLELRRFVSAQFGDEMFQKVVQVGGVPPRIYAAASSYPDDEFVTIASTTSSLTGVPVAELLERFGVFIAPTLMSMYSTLIPASWRTLDLLEHTEGTIHAVVRRRNPTAAPANIGCERTGPTTAVVRYSSARRVCPIAKGIMIGVGRHYGENLLIHERACMSTGSAACEFDVSVV